MPESSATGETNASINNFVGNSPDVTPGLKVENRTISSADQVIQVCQTMIEDWKKGILNSARITSKINGERPYNQKKLDNALKGYKTNISTGFLATECRKVAPRLHMPISTAKYLTAAALPEGWADGDMKTEYFRARVTKAIRSWPKWNFYVRGLAREVAYFGFAFNVFPDELEWRPMLMRMDKGFVPQGTEVMDTEPQFFMAKYDYKPDELLKLLKANVDADRDEWKKKNVVQAINGAMTPSVDATYPEARSYEDLIRQATWTFTYAKGAKLIQAWHLFAKETTGKVSHYIVLGDQSGTVQSNQNGDNNGSARLLYEALDQFDSMESVVNTVVFDYGDGTIHGVWGVGQILYDLSVQVEKIRCDSVDNMRMTNKMKLQVPDAKNVNDVKLNVTSETMIVSGAQFAGNSAAMPQDINGYELLDQKLSQIAREKIGSFIPPIPLGPSDIKASQINAKVSDERELQEDMLECWLIQLAPFIRNMTARLMNPANNDPIASDLQKDIKERLTPEEVKLLVEDRPSQSVATFTEYAAQKRGMFSNSVMGNPLFNQSALARSMAEGAGDERFVQSVVLPEGDQSDQIRATRDQLVENASLALGQPTPILKTDNDWVHMQTLKPGLMQTLQSGNTQLAELGLQHYAAHWSQGVNKKMIPKDQINAEKSFISKVEETIQALKEKEAIAQQHQQAGLPPPEPNARPMEQVSGVPTQ